MFGSLFEGTQGGAGADHQVIPFHYFDDTPLFRRIILHNLMVFDEVLDADILHQSLERLASKPTWRKLGARIRVNRAGKLEYHIPNEFTADRPAIRYTHTDHDMPIASHPLGSRLPRPSPSSSRPAIVADPDEFVDLAAGPSPPRSFNDYLASDLSVFGLHICSFRDATLVNLQWFHAASDAMGLGTILSAWTLAIEGRDDEIPEQHGFELDPLTDLGRQTQTPTTEPHRFVDAIMSPWQTVLFAGKMLIDLFLVKKEARMLFIPGEFVTRLRNEAMAQWEAEAAEEVVVNVEVIKEKKEEGENGEKKNNTTTTTTTTTKSNPYYLSENDILTAYLTILATSHLHPDTEICSQNVMCIRHLLPSSWLPRDRAYVSNCVGVYNLILPKVSAIQSSSSSSPSSSKKIGHLARLLRSELDLQRTMPQVEACHALMRKGPVLTPLLLGKGAGTYQLGFTSWSRAELFKVDFGGAVKGGKIGNGETGEKGERKVCCRPRYIQPTHQGLKLAEAYTIVGKDGEGNFWVEACRNRGLWEGTEREFLAEVM